MPALSKKQQKFMGIVRSIQKGEQPASKFSKDARDAAKDMKKSSVKKFASTKHKGLPMKKEILGKLKEMIKQELSEYTYGVGDVVKDVNPTCPHYGAQGKVKSVNPRSVVFVVMNKGKNFKPGMELEKSHDQMKKMNEINYKKDTPRSLKKSNFKQLDILVPKGRVSFVVNKLKKEIRGIKIRHEEVDSYTKDGVIVSNFKKDDINKIMAIADHAGSLFENKVYKVGDTVSLLSFDRRHRGKAKVKGVTKSRANKFGIKNHYITNKGTFTDMEVEGTEAFKLRFKGDTEKKVTKAMNSPYGVVLPEAINEKKKMFPPDKMTPKQAKEYKKFIDYAKMGIEYKIDMSLFESINEDGHTDVASSKRKVMIMVDDSNKLLNKLNGMNKEDSLPSWWSDKITLSQNYLQKATNYLLNPVESVNEAKYKVHMRDKKRGNFELEKFQTGGQSYDYKKGMDIVKKLRKMSSSLEYKLVKESVNERSFHPDSPFHNDDILKDMKKKGYIKKGQDNELRRDKVTAYLVKHAKKRYPAYYGNAWIRALQSGLGGRAQDWWMDMYSHIRRFLRESVNEARLDPKQLLQQLGGNRFIAMTGAKNLAIDKPKNELHMKIGRNAKGVSHVRIRLTSMDLYDMEFLQVRAGRIKIKSKEKGVYADQLGKMFKKNTGMNVRL